MNTRHYMKLIIVAVALQCTACAANVKPWERGTLAKAHMAVEPDPLERTIREQIVTSKEAASGAFTVEGGGCGCN